MKKTSSFGLTVLLGGALNSVAIERPAVMDQKIPKAEAITPTETEEQLKKTPETTPEQPEATPQPWLGVGGQPIHEDLALHLGIDGGLLLKTVVKESPAEQAGIQSGDIITSLDGEKIYDQNGLRRAILKHLPGAEIEIGWRHQGESIKRSIKLGKRAGLSQINPRGSFWDQQKKGLHQRSIPQPQLRGMGLDDDIMQELRKMQQFSMRGFGGGPFGGLHSGRDLHMRLSDILGKMQQGGNGFNMGLQSSSTGAMTYEDNEGSIEVQTKDQNRQLTIRDRSGKILFEGPYNTQEEKDALPEDLKERVESLGIDGKSGPLFEFKLNDDGFGNEGLDPDRAPEPKPAPGTGR